MNPITMKLVVDDLILQALREDITFEDVSTAIVCPHGAPRHGGAYRQRPMASSPVWMCSPAPSSCWIRRAPCCLMLPTVTRCTPAITWARCAATRACCFRASVALNYLQRMSGIATYTHRMAAALEGTKTVLVDTRKTTPGMRVFEKAAVEIGGGSNHRYNLSTAVMLKDNHIDAAGGVTRAIEMARAHASFTTTVEIECENLDMVREAVEAGADIIMLDNMTHDDMAAAIELIAGRAKTECSGNVDADNISRPGRSGC